MAFVTDDVKAAASADDDNKMNEINSASECQRPKKVIYEVVV